MTAGLLLILGTLAAADEPPRSTNPAVAVDLFAEAPDVVTPVGIAVDPKGRVLVVESHTHFRPNDYAGPAADRIRVLEDRDRDGRAEVVETFFEGTKYTMGLGFHPDGPLYVATRWEVFRLRDENGDARADGPPETLVKLETPGDYPHNGLSGFAFDSEGRVYFGLGENLGADYKLVGKDGATIAGGGEGGSVFRCRPDGTGLERVATGFWNPFHLAFDPFGRLFAVDNDPDSRPPCRLIHVVSGGDYGYRFRNGRKGLHPFTAWNGELPGTLPMAAGTGEAPSGVLVYGSDHLPASLRGDLLVTSWGDHRVDRFRTRAEGASVRASGEPLVTGGESFRPVGLACAPDGSVYVSDWVDRSYTLHGKGRVWRLRSRLLSARVNARTDEDGLVHADRATRGRRGGWLRRERPGTPSSEPH
ncbi:MAG: PVC-type heme-binding CxxCH protein [Isosphaeraceae bacterium]